MYAIGAVEVGEWYRDQCEESELILSVSEFFSGECVLTLWK
jgi:hypothetical protein